jgi:hypothetical protein
MPFSASSSRNSNKAYLKIRTSIRANAVNVVASEKFQAEALNAQRRSFVLLENKDRVLPLNRAGKRVFL